MSKKLWCAAIDPDGNFIWPFPDNHPYFDDGDYFFYPDNLPPEQRNFYITYMADDLDSAKEEGQKLYQEMEASDQWGIDNLSKDDIEGQLNE